MNWLLFISGLFAVFTTVGHFIVGGKRFLKPMLQAPFDEVSKKVMHCVFHYISVFLVISTIALLASGFCLIPKTGDNLLVKFIALNYAFFALTQIVIALTSKLHMGIFKLFQWIFFILIAVFALLGVS
ncbi:MAG TPA: hypothetical protein ENH82_10665 [bacterium]|nr:hypothetical protein [bacterium]